MAEFPLPTKAEISGGFTLSGKSLQFGDGYEQLSVSGLDRINRIWDVEVIISDSISAESFKEFLLEHGQHLAFEWKSPSDVSLGNYRILGKVSSTRRNGGGSKPIFFSRKMQFEKVYGLSSLAVVVSSTTYYFAASNEFEIGSTTYDFAPTYKINAGSTTYSVPGFYELNGGSTSYSSINTLLDLNSTTYENPDNLDIDISATTYSI